MILDTPKHDVEVLSGDAIYIANIEPEGHPQEGKGPETKFKKKRLRRRASGFDKSKERWVRRSETRNEVVGKAKKTFGYIAGDVKKKEYALSGIIRDQVKFETSRTAYPEPNDDVVR